MVFERTTLVHECIRRSFQFQVNKKERVIYEFEMIVGVLILVMMTQFLPTPVLKAGMDFRGQV